ncbi:MULTISPECIES: cation:proton antiporter [unclassified Devosia]|uniref:cation:proton antiporter n=1 Tax=unclassified Devosia TaxID=196773 RepID=UPI0015529759|nr:MULTISPECIES: cation:proton antiporter [unclassified Devosia]
MNVYQFAALILAAIGPVLALSGYLKAPASVVLFALGVASAFLPGLPQVNLDADLALTLFLPLLVYASTLRVSWHLLRFTFVPGVLLGGAQILVTVVLVVGAAKLLLPGLSWPAALFLGVIASIFDTQLFHEAKGRPRVPRAIADVLKARELVSRVFILGTLALAGEALNAGEITASSTAFNYLFDIPAGIVLGCVIGYAIVWLRRRVDPAPVEIAVSIAAPYIAALLAELLGISGVAAITATALVISAERINRHTGATVSSAESRISSVAFWEQASLMVSSVLFFLAGRALPEALASLESWSISMLVLVTSVLLAITLAVQFAASLPAVLIEPIAGALQARKGRPALGLQTAGVMAWASTRSVIALIIALSIPAQTEAGAPFPERNLIVVIAAFLVIGSLVLQGLTLKPVVVRADLVDEGEEEGEVDLARATIRRAAESGDPDEPHRPARQALLALRVDNRIGDEVLTRMLRETDLDARASEENVLPGAGPPNP